MASDSYCAIDKFVHYGMVYVAVLFILFQYFVNSVQNRCD